jgi:hypothetical protein
MAASLTVGSAYDLSPSIFGAQDFHRQRVRVTLAGPQTANQAEAPTATTLLMGSCLGIITATGKAVLVNSADTDGSQQLMGILARDTETAFGDQVVIAYITGSFLADKLLFGGTDTLANHFNKWSGKAIAVEAMYAEPSTPEPDSAWN